MKSKSQWKSRWYQFNLFQKRLVLQSDKEVQRGSERSSKQEKRIKRNGDKGWEEEGMIVKDWLSTIKKWAVWLKGFSKWAEHLRVLRGRWTLNSWESWIRGTVCCDPGRPWAPLLRAWEQTLLFGGRLEGGVGARLLQKKVRSWVGGGADCDDCDSHIVRQPDETLWFVKKPHSDYFFQHQKEAAYDIQFWSIFEQHVQENDWRMGVIQRWHRWSPPNQT